MSGRRLRPLVIRRTATAGFNVIGERHNCTKSRYRDVHALRENPAMENPAFNNAAVDKTPDITGTTKILILEA